MKAHLFGKCSYRARSFVFLSLLTILLRSQIVYTHSANAQADESSDYGGSESSPGDKLSLNDEIYAPEQLQQEIEAIERRIPQNFQTINQNSNERHEQQSKDLTDGKNWEAKSKQHPQSSAEYYDDAKHLKELFRPYSEYRDGLDQSEISLDEKNNEAKFSTSEYNNTQEERDRLKDEILKTIQQELEHRKSRKNEPFDEASIIKNMLVNRPQQKQKPQWQTNQHDQYEYYDDEMLEKEDKQTHQPSTYDFSHTRRETSTDPAITGRILKEGNNNSKKNLPESNRAENTHISVFPTMSLLPPTSKITSPGATLTPDVFYGTSLPKPLALGPLNKPTLPATSTSQPPDSVAPIVITTPMAVAPLTTTAIQPAGKQGKQINILRRKLEPHEKLRNYIEDAYIRMPLAVIVDPSTESLEKTKALWRDALRTNLKIKIVLVSLNASGAPAAYSFNSTRQFLAGLNSIKEQRGGDAFIGVLHASELVPYDSAVFISTSTLSPYTELIQDAAITLLKKRIRLYLLWFGERALSENETQDSVGGILGEVAIRSGGDILHIFGNQNSQELDGSNHMILVADNFQGSQEIEVPVDRKLSSLHVRVDAATRTVTLETPYGDMNLKKFIKFKSHILPKEYLDAYVPLTKITKNTIFTLKIVPEKDNEYFVFVRADRKADNFLEDMIRRYDSYFMEGVPYYPTSFKDVQISTHDNLKFPEDKNMNRIDIENERNDPKDQVETFSGIEIKNSSLEGAKTNTSSDVFGAKTAIESQKIAQGRNILQTSVTRIEMSTQSQLIVEPGKIAQLFFEVTNLRSEPVFHNVQVVDERRFLARLVPQSLFLRPGETTTVTVTVSVPSNTQQGTVDHIIFTCQGSGTASLSLNLRVNNVLNVQDNIPPVISWKFGSRCEYASSDSSNCAERFWTVDITAQDWESGILRLQSTPTNRLIYRNAYTVGSTESLKATYVATCCEPKVSLVAFDVSGNQRSYNIDVRDIYLTEAAIAAIVLGCLLLLLLLVLLIWWICVCCRRRKIVLDLPTYRSHSTRSME